ncbi:MAG: hypothetical protein OMM_05120 [Candidatus Magnetoglobus multicellularis str. Araruama]|uniref:EF-hand domain-containing protein n=1 Tax=Candidatus Magnetoglobus multicellularis str. Araruama TaxID=890399 RepID=A0A1V1NY43_9BACT|nr:MAG: hypothetical protein OMM_05120 [Candidatus Magnetoglobus multicellularis str. Araruama]
MAKHTLFHLTLELLHGRIGQRIEILGSGENILISQDLIRQGTGTGRVDDWSNEEFTFTADSSSSTIRFTDITPVSHASDAILDDVSINIASCDCTDSDGDGVINQLDTCPDTPEGSAVFADGCPTDAMYSEEQMNTMVSGILTWGDLDGDKKITLIEAIKALRITVGVNEPATKK